MTTLLLLAGHATRMRPLSNYLNKGMIPVAGKPLAEHVVDSLVRQGFRDIVIVATAFPEQLQHHFGDGSRLGARIRILHRPQPSGTAGDTLAARDLLPAEEPFLLHYGDILTNLDLRGLVHQHELSGAAATLGLVTRVQVHTGVAELDTDNRITYFEEKPPVGRPCHAAVDVLGPRVWAYLAPGLDFGYHVFPRMLAAGEHLHGFLDETAWWLDVGRLSDLDTAAELIRQQI